MVKSCLASSAQKSTASARAKLIKRLWLPEEDDVLGRIVKVQGPGNWAYIAKHLPGRIGKQCRERWYNHLCPSIKKAEWSLEEKWVLFLGYTLHGSQWRKMTALLPGRTDNSIKNCWNSSLKKLIGSFEVRLETALAQSRAGQKESFSCVERGLLEEIQRERTRVAAQGRPQQFSFEQGRALVIFNAAARPPFSPISAKTGAAACNSDKENKAFNANRQTPPPAHGFNPFKGSSAASTDNSLPASNSKSRHCFMPVRSPRAEVFPSQPVTAFDPDHPAAPITRKVICFDFYDLCPS